MCSSPWLIAAYHVLHRLLMPRHSPCALHSLTSLSSFVWFSELCKLHKKLFLANCNYPKIYPYCCFFYLLIFLPCSVFKVQLSFSSCSSQFDLLIEVSIPWNFNQQISFSHSSLVFLWWAQVDSNHRPHDYQSCALTS